MSHHRTLRRHRRSKAHRRSKEHRRSKAHRRKTHRKTHKKKNSDSGYKPSVHNSMPKCVKLFKKYKLTDQKKLVRWINHNHTDKADARGSVQSQTLQDDYKFITGCFANRKKIFQAMKSFKSMKSKSKSKKKKVKEIKGGSPSMEELITQIESLKGFLMNYYPEVLRIQLEHDLGGRYDRGGLNTLYDYAIDIGILKNRLDALAKGSMFWARTTKRDALISLIIKKLKNTRGSVLTEWFENMSSEELDHQLGVKGGDKGAIRKSDAVEWHHTPTEIKEIQLRVLIDIIQQKMMNSLVKLGIFNPKDPKDQRLVTMLKDLEKFPIPSPGTQSDAFLIISRDWARDVASEYDDAHARRDEQEALHHAALAGRLPADDLPQDWAKDIASEYGGATSPEIPATVGTSSSTEDFAAVSEAVQKQKQARGVAGQRDLNAEGRIWHFRKLGGVHLTYNQIISNIRIFDAYMNKKLTISKEQWKQNSMIKAQMLEADKHEAAAAAEAAEAEEAGSRVESSSEGTEKAVNLANQAQAEISRRYNSEEKKSKERFIAQKVTDSSGRGSNLSKEQRKAVVSDRTNTLLNMYGKGNVGFSGSLPPGSGGIDVENEEFLRQYGFLK